MIDPLWQRVFVEVAVQAAVVVCVGRTCYLLGKRDGCTEGHADGHECQLNAVVITFQCPGCGAVITATRNGTSDSGQGVH